MVNQKATIINHRGTEFTETLSIPFHPFWKSPPIASGIVVSVRSSSVRSVTLRFYSRKPPGFYHCSMIPHKEPMTKVDKYSRREQ